MISHSDHARPSSLATLADREWSYARELTPRRLALGAARLMLQQHLWGRPTSKSHALGRLTLLESLCVAAGGNYTEDGVPAQPDEPEAAAVLAATCQLLAERLTDDPMPGEVSPVGRLDQLRAVSAEDNANIQRLLATVHGAASDG
jgi:hypothetical protein